VVVVVAKMRRLFPVHRSARHEKSPMPDTSVETPQEGKPYLVPRQGLKAISLVLLSVIFPLGILLNSALSNVELSTVSHLAGPRWNGVNLPSLSALADHKAVIVETECGETLCIIGGHSRQVYCYPLGAIGVPDGAMGGPAYSLEEALSYHAATVVGNRTYVLGGDAEKDDHLRRKVYCVQRDTESGRWIVNTDGIMPRKVMQHAAVTVDNRIYIIGGFDDEWNYVADVWWADVGAGCAALGEDDWEEENSLHTGDGSLYGVTGHAAVSVVLDNGKKYIYVIGGLTGTVEDSRPTNTVLRAEVVDGSLDGWYDLGGVRNMPGTWLLTAAVSGRYLYVLGGTTSLYAKTSSPEVYRAWIEDNGDLTWLPQPQGLPVPLHAHAIAVSRHGRLYVVGGSSNGVRQDKIYFTPLLDFEKRATTDGPVTYGDTISYTLEFTNLGVRDFKTLNITDTFQIDVPSRLELHYPLDKCRRYSDDTITCIIHNLGIEQTVALNLAVTFSQPSLIALSAPTSFHYPLPVSTSHITWTHVCSAARLEVLGVGISNLSTDTLHIPSPGTIIGNIRVQAVFKIEPGEELGDVTFFSGGVGYRLIEPTSTHNFTAVYEQDVEVSDVISVTMESVDREKACALTAYFLRGTTEEHSLIGRTMNQALHRETYTDVLKLPLPVSSGEVTVKAVVTDNNDPKRDVILAVQAGNVSQQIITNTPSHGNYLNILELQLGGVPTTTDEVTVVAQSPSESGESFGLVGLVAETDCRSIPAPTPIPLRVLNQAQVCENVGTDSSCWYATCFNTDMRLYLPIVLKTPTQTCVSNCPSCMLENIPLIGANLERAEVTDEQPAQAESLKGVTMPDGAKHD